MITANSYWGYTTTMKNPTREDRDTGKQIEIIDYAYIPDWTKVGEGDFEEETIRKVLDKADTSLVAAIIQYDSSQHISSIFCPWIHNRFEDGQVYESLKQLNTHYITTPFRKDAKHRRWQLKLFWNIE